MGNSTQSGDPDHHFVPPPTPDDTDHRHARWPRFTALPPVLKSPDPAYQAPSQSPAPAPPDPPDVLVVGVCSSGKSTLVRRLREAGYNARACAQEHSYVPHLWQLSNPRVLVYLDASLSTIRRRRRAHWQQGTLEEEHRRLAHARRHCDLYIPTDGLLPEDVAARVVGYLKTRITEDGRQQTTDSGR